MTQALQQAQAAAVAGLSMTNLARLASNSDDPPLREPGGKYPCEAFGQWLTRRFERRYGVTEEGTQPTVQSEKARLTRAQADKAELHAAQMASVLVRVEDVESEWTRMLGSMRARLLSLPSKVGPSARAALSDGEAAALIEQEVLEALAELSGDGRPSRARIDRGDPSQDDADPASAAEDDGESVGRRRAAPQPRKLGRPRKVAD